MPIIESMNHFLWGVPLLAILLGTHLFFTIKLNFPQKHIFKAIKLSIKGDATDTSVKNLSNFATLTTTLAATLGTGNIIGVSTAVALGGPGAVFWCWITGILGMATSYAECYLSTLYKHKNQNGIYCGGPMYVLEKGLHCKPLGIVSAFLTLCAALGIGSMVQANAIKETLHVITDIPPIFIGLTTACITGCVIIGGISSISKFCMKAIPFLGFLYIICCIFLLWLFNDVIIDSICLILESAFCQRAASSGFIGSTLMTSARFGIARGLFTNEAGIGTASIAAGASSNCNPTYQGLISMTAVFWDTVVICALTGIVIVANIVKFPDSIVTIGSGNYTSAAFAQLPLGYGSTLLFFILVSFAFTTLIGWCYFGEVSFHYLFPNHNKKGYQSTYLIMIMIGALLPLEFVWSLTDFINALMVFPNVLALWCLHSRIANPFFLNTCKN